MKSMIVVSVMMIFAGCKIPGAIATIIDLSLISGVVF
jgi:hypothetical protein